MATSARIVVIVLNWNGVEDTCECLDALLRSSNVEFRIKLVDNGSRGDDFERLATRYAADSRIDVQRNESNLGFAAGMNKAIGEVLADGDCDYIALLNNDAVVEPDWLHCLVSEADQSGAWILASKMVDYENRDRLDNAGHVWLNTGEILPRGAGLNPADFSRSAELVGPCAGAALYRADLFRKIGVFDRFFETGYEDAELGLRAYLAGHPTRFCPGAVVYHKMSRSVDKIRDLRYAVRLQRNIVYTTVKLTPAWVLLLNLPFIALKTVAVPLCALLLLRLRLFRVQTTALVQSGRDLPRALSARRKRVRWPRGATRAALSAQDFFLRTYLRYFRRYILQRRKTVFER